ncbi:MAG: ATP-binding protein [Pseudomonadota bacterium]
MAFYPRFLQSAIAAALSDTPVVCLLGPRQTGKTTLCRTLSADRAYFTLDDHTTYVAACKDPTGFIQSLPYQVTLDEVQRAPELLFAIKMAVDRDRSPGRFLLTGSANLLLLPRVQESLAGRIEILHLHPLTEAEKEQQFPHFLTRLLDQQLAADMQQTQQALSGIAERLCQGGYPEPNTRKPHRARQWFAQYLQTIIRNDARDVANFRAQDDLYNLMQLLALRTGCLLNTQHIATELKLSRETVDKYIRLLEHLFLVYRLPAWHNNQAKRLIKTPKHHLVDSGLAAALNRLKAEHWQPCSTQFGALLEGFVIQQIRAQATWLDEPVQLSHYRDKDQVEVDLVIERGRDVYGVEIKKSATIHDKSGAGLRRLARQAGSRFQGGALIYCGNNAIALDVPHCFAIPIDWLWRKLS